MKTGNTGEIDYIRGRDPVVELGGKEKNRGFNLPAMDKHDLLKMVTFDGALPSKTFSMGEAREKRFHMECRKIRQNGLKVRVLPPQPSESIGRTSFEGGSAFFVCTGIR